MAFFSSDMKSIEDHTNVQVKSAEHGEATKITGSNKSQIKGGTDGDRHDMYRMNKQQELRRNFRFLSIFGYSLLLGNGWAIAITNLLIPLSNGGSAGMVWIYFVVICGMSFSTLSLAELASMAPTA